MTVCGSDFKFLALLHLRYPLLPYARLSALSSSPSYHGTLPHSSSDPSQILLASFDCPLRTTACCHDQRAFLSSPARLQALTGHVPIYLGHLHRILEQQWLSDVQKHVSISKEHCWTGHTLLINVHGTLFLKKQQVPLVCPG